MKFADAAELADQEWSLARACSPILDSALAQLTGAGRIVTGNSDHYFMLSSEQVSLGSETAPVYLQLRRPAPLLASVFTSPSPLLFVMLPIIALVAGGAIAVAVLKKEKSDGRYNCPGVFVLRTVRLKIGLVRYSGKMPSAAR